MQTPINRRRFLRQSWGGLFGLAAAHGWSRLFSAETARSTKHCIVLWMAGGPSQLETFDPKPNTATGGPTRAIDTTVPGLRIAEHLPHIAQRCEHLAILRGLTSPEGDHARGTHLLQTGYPFVQAFPRPSLGAVVSHENGGSDLPHFVSLGARGLGPAYLGADHAPFAVEDPGEVVRLLTELQKQRLQLQRLRVLGAEFERQHLDAALDRRAATLQRLERLLVTPFAKSLDLRTASESDRQRYGDSPFGQRCLLARRLLEAGVKFVEVYHEGWDTHADNFTNVAQLCREIDAPWATLIDDLRASGLWDETVIVWMGEFGRTPQINGNTGRDHFPKVTPVVLGGGRVAGGRSFGHTDRLGLEIESGRVTVPDLFATLLQALGIDPRKEFRTEFGAIAPASDHGSVIDGLL
uniref:DUF1501 domain-containing protein n=1 Tax=Schlesneria paludicola TaxID=360056 RepID=A0A7C4QR80_9PLAN